VVEANRRNAVSGGKLLVTADPKEAVRGANAVYTDIWASMGRESEAAERKKVFEPYQVNSALMREAEVGALVMHDLPAHRREEITDEVMDSPTAVIFDQAENRLHIQKAIVLECLGAVDAVNKQLR
jgi:ornithine carbamoyltransferase